MSGNESKKPSSRAGCVVGIVVVLAMLLGFVIILWGGKSKEHGGLFTVIGATVFMLPLLGAMALTLLPEKVRGVKEVPMKERVLQKLMILSVIMAFGGFLSAIAIGQTENVKMTIFFGIVAAVGFISVFIVSAVHTHVTKKQSMTIELFPTDPEQDKQDAETVREVMGEIFKKNEEGLSDEERERELRRIERQDRAMGAGMTREQVEEYENRKRSGK